jgi:hypothetical protein
MYFLDEKIKIIKKGISRQINAVNHNGTIVLFSVEFNFSLQFKRLFKIKKSFIKNKNIFKLIKYLFFKSPRT